MRKVDRFEWDGNERARFANAAVKPPCKNCKESWWEHFGDGTCFFIEHASERHEYEPDFARVPTQGVRA